MLTLPAVQTLKWVLLSHQPGSHCHGSVPASTQPLHFGNLHSLSDVLQFAYLETCIEEFALQIQIRDLQCINPILTLYAQTAGVAIFCPIRARAHCRVRFRRVSFQCECLGGSDSPSLIPLTAIQHFGLRK